MITWYSIIHSKVNTRPLKAYLDKSYQCKPFFPLSDETLMTGLVGYLKFEPLQIKKKNQKMVTMCVRYEETFEIMEQSSSKVIHKIKM